MYIRLLVVIFLFILTISEKAHAQVKIAGLTFREALQKIKEENKMLMVVMDDRLHPPNNDFTTQALADTSITDINKFAIVIRPSTSSSDWDSLNNRYFSFSAMGTLFFNSKGVLIHRYDAINIHGHAYLVQANDAYASINLPTEEDQLTALVKSNFSDVKLLKQLIDTRKLSKEPIDDLLEPFITRTSIDSFDSYQYFYLLARFAPVLTTKADSILRHRQSFNQNWYAMEPSERSDINREIVRKTLNTAVANKDIDLAVYLSIFSSNIISNATERSRSKAQIKTMTDFYFRINDTAKYLQCSANYIDNYYMDLNIDSLKNFYIKKEKDSAENGGHVTIYANGASAENLPYFSEFRSIGDLLNQHAWRFYKMTQDSLLRLKALGWAKRSLEFNKDPHSMDTYARLLYVTGERKTAVKEEEKALDEYKKHKLEKSIPAIEQTLERMKSNLDQIDN